MIARRLLAAKWNLLRLGVSALLLWIVLSDTPARLARLQYASLPEFDAAAEVRSLRAEGRYGEALMVADAALDTARSQAASEPGPAHDRFTEIERERQKTADEQGSYVRRATDMGLGAVSGTGGSLERLIGAVAADFFVVGDVRDLVIQGGRLVIDGETDEVILVLSGVGVATTVLPEVDWVPSILKAARKTGAMTRGLAEFIARTARRADWQALRPLLRDVRTLAQRASPGGAVRLLRHADSPEDVAALARFVERQPQGAFALHVTGREGADMVKSASKAADAGAIGAKSGAAAAEHAVVLAARKGTPGAAWLRTGAHRAMLRPHFIVGLAKGLYKGNAQDLAARVAAALDPRARWLIPLLAAWVFVELALLTRRLAPRRPGRAPDPAPQPA